MHNCYWTAVVHSHMDVVTLICKLILILFNTNWCSLEEIINHESQTIQSQSIDNESHSIQALEGSFQVTPAIFFP